MLPEIIVDGDPVIELTLPPETRQKLEELLESLPTAVFTAQDSLGWTYQYWRADEKDRVNNCGGKIGADELPALTQLFTERYLVLFLLHNTVGAWRTGRVLAEDAGLAASAPDEAAVCKRMRISTGGGYDFTYLRFIREKARGDGGDARSGALRPAAGPFLEWSRRRAASSFLTPAAEAVTSWSRLSSFSCGSASRRKDSRRAMPFARC